MKTIILTTLILIFLGSPAPAFEGSPSDTEAAQNFAIALKKGQEITDLIELFKKIPTHSPLKNWANRLAVEELGSQWLALTKKSSRLP